MFSHSCRASGFSVVVVITPLLPRDGGTPRTAIQVHAVKADLRSTDYEAVAPTTTNRRDAVVVRASAL